MRKRWYVWAPMFIMTACILCGLVYFLPPVHDRLAWRVRNGITSLKYALNPPQEVLFIPQEGMAEDVPATLAAYPPVAETVTLPAPQVTTEPAQPTLSPTPLATPTPQPTPTAIPSRVVLEGVRHEYQKFNNCGPANLAMALSYWGWGGDQRVTAAYLRPDERDKNVMPDEMARFVESNKELRALVRVGGDLHTLKRFIAAGFPVIIEKGHDPPKDWWMGHFLVVNGYDDEKQVFITQDSLIAPDLKLPYKEIEQGLWRDFNYVYLVIYPPEREAQVFELLGPQADETANFRYAAQKAQNEIPTLKGRDQFFAWYDLGSSRVALGEYAQAAEAYDQAFAIYARLSEEDRPYRMLWYQVGPYPAYYYSGRYQDVISLANTTFAWVGEPVLEETYYWRGMARLAIGENEKAVSDFKKAAKLNPNSTGALAQLSSMGVAFP